MTTAIASVPALTLVLPPPPFLNDAYKCWRNRVVLTQAGKDYKKTVWALAREQMRAAYRGGAYPLYRPGHDVKLYIAWFRSSQRGDLDGLNKLLWDSLEGTVYANDRQVAACFAWRVDVPAGTASLFDNVPRVEIRVEPWSPTQAPVF